MPAPPSPGCRKFACFAIGNAGFHNPTLYDALRPAVGPLVKLLSDDEEKTRANAAGALGNLVRNSGQLCSEIIKVRSAGVGVLAPLGWCTEQFRAVSSRGAACMHVLRRGMERGVCGRCLPGPGRDEAGLCVAEQAPACASTRKLGLNDPRTPTSAD